MNTPLKIIIKFQIGPVQDFIAAARSTRDLWSGSYLLSFLTAAGIRKLTERGGELIFPNSERQPLLDQPDIWRLSSHQQDQLTPNLPNLFVAILDGPNPIAVAEAVEKAIRQEWRKIAQSCLKSLVFQNILHAEESQTVFFGQTDSFLSIAWQITPLANDYESAYQRNAWHLDAVRQTRDFKAIPPGHGGEKDSLSGKDQALVRGSDELRKRIRDNDYRNLFKHDDHLSAISLIKRVWHLAYLVDVLGLKADSNGFPIRSTRAIAARDNRKDDEDDPERPSGEKYLAAIAFDGDSIGKWVSGENLADGSRLREHHSDFSKALSQFALGEVRKIVEKPDARTGIPLGFLIYAGGDDVVALVPADAALAVANQLRGAFTKSTLSIKGKDGHSPDASAGIAIAHFKSPLQDLIRAAQNAEKRAKNTVGRSAFSITLMKRSGEISQWGAKWDDGAVELHDAIFKAMSDQKLSGKFPHRVCQLLEPYLTARTGISRQSDVAGFPAHELIEKEFHHAATRQGSKAIADELREPLANYLNHLDAETQTALTAIIGLCTTLAFIHRNLPDHQSAERHALA